MSIDASSAEGLVPQQQPQPSPAPAPPVTTTFDSPAAMPSPALSTGKPTYADSPSSSLPTPPPLSSDAQQQQQHLALPLPVPPPLSHSDSISSTIAQPPTPGSQPIAPPTNGIKRPLEDSPAPSPAPFVPAVPAEPSPPVPSAAPASQPQEDAERESKRQKIEEQGAFPTQGSIPPPTPENGTPVVVDGGNLVLNLPPAPPATAPAQQAYSPAPPAPSPSLVEPKPEPMELSIPPLPPTTLSSTEPTPSPLPTPSPAPVLATPTPAYTPAPAAAPPTPAHPAPGELSLPTLATVDATPSPLPLPVPTTSTAQYSVSPAPPTPAPAPGLVAYPSASPVPAAAPPAQPAPVAHSQSPAPAPVAYSQSPAPPQVPEQPQQPAYGYPAAPAPAAPVAYSQSPAPVATHEYSASPAAPTPAPVAYAQPTPSPAPVVAAAPTPVAGYDPSGFAPPVYAPVPAASPAPGTPQSGPIPVLTRQQHRWAVQLVRTLKKHKSAGPFTRPVDPIALLIPDYHKVITRPTDLGTIDGKLSNTGKAITAAEKKGRQFGLDYQVQGEAWEGASASVYRTLDEFKEELGRVWDNCFRYNGPRDKNPVSAMAGQLQDVADKEYKKAPTAPAIEYKPEPPRLPTPEVQKKERRPSNSFVPVIRRSEEGTRPKREIHAPSKDLPESMAGQAAKKLSGKVAQEQLKFCKEVVKELFSKKYGEFAFPFYVPVDYVTLNLPNYPSIVKKPMDLGTIRQKLDTNQYPLTPSPYIPFEADVRLVFKNCYLFNPAGTLVNEWGHKLEEVFERKWEERPMEDEDDGSDDEQIHAMERQLQALAAQIETMKAKKKADKEHRAAERAASSRAPKPKKMSIDGGLPNPYAVASAPAAAPKKSGGGAKKRQSGGGQAKKPKKKKEYEDSDDEEWKEEMEVVREPEEVTFEMKRELAVKIVSFEGDNLEKAIDIIRQGRPDLLSDANKEIELDIDQLDQRTLLNLYKFVCPSAAPVRTKAPAKKGARAQTGGTKRKNLDEIKESERIEMLEARLRDFENGGGGGAAAAAAAAAAATPQAMADEDQASSDSSSDSESGSDSDDD
ncbi:hypothetical protein MNV49_001321 [Pseudohyphozyma bogoriensis]|nr:hypothetical protein MNV49_001321 [Pseudohyphozyma bogoriensis]